MKISQNRYLVLKLYSTFEPKITVYHFPKFRYVAQILLSLLIVLYLNLIKKETPCRNKDDKVSLLTVEYDAR